MYSTVHPSGNLVQDQPSSSSSAAASGGVELAPGVGKPTGTVQFTPHLFECRIYATCLPFFTNPSFGPTKDKGLVTVEHFLDCAKSAVSNFEHVNSLHLYDIAAFHWLMGNAFIV